MVGLLMASFVGGAVAYTCPGSPSFIHANTKVTLTAAASCAAVKQEMKDRIALKNGWYDQHNRGTYTEQSYGGDFSVSRVTGNGQYTDKIIFDLADSGSSCKVQACSESQSTSVADSGANYCNSKLLVCGSDEGCKVAVTDISNSDESYKASFGASGGLDNCLVASSMNV